MEVTLEVLDPRTARRTYRSMETLHAKVREIITDQANHRRALCIAKFPLPQERRMAYKTRQNLIRVYGSTPSIAGLTFTTLRSTDDQEEYLTCHYDPDAIVDGEYEAFRDHYEAKYQAKQAKRKARK